MNIEHTHQMNEASQTSKKPLRDTAIEFLAACDAVLEDVWRDILREVVKQERELPMPFAHFPYGRTSINDDIWKRMGRLGVLVRENRYHEDSEEKALKAHIREMMMYEVFRLAYTPDSDLLLPGTQEETEKFVDTFTSIPTIKEFIASTASTASTPKAPPRPTLPLDPRHVDDITGATDALEALAGRNKERKLRKDTQGEKS